MSTDTLMPDEIAEDLTRRDLEAYERTQDLCDALDPDDLEVFNLEVVDAVGILLNIAARMQEWRPKLLELPDFDIGHLDRLPDVARGLRYVHSLIRRRIDRPNAKPQLAAEGFALREVMLLHCKACAVKKRFPQEVIDKVVEGSGYRDLVSDLFDLAHELLARPELLGSAAAVDRDDVARALAIAEELNFELGVLESGKLSPEELNLRRRKLGTLAIRSRNQLRRAMDYLRFAERDADLWVPSLYPSTPRGTGGNPAPTPEQRLTAAHDHLHAQQAPAPVATPVDPEFNPFEPTED